jgi:hypothetical protein
MPHLARIAVIVPLAYSWAMALFSAGPSGSCLRVAMPIGADRHPRYEPAA